MVLWEHDDIIERWKGYYVKLLNEENPRTVFGDVVPNAGLTPAISRKEVEVALKGMKHETETGPDGIPVAVWKILGEEGVDMFWICSRRFSSRRKCQRNGQYDCTNLQREGGHPRLWEL